MGFLVLYVALVMTPLVFACALALRDRFTGTR